MIRVSNFHAPRPSWGASHCDFRYRTGAHARRRIRRARSGGGNHRGESHEASVRSRRRRRAGACRSLRRGFGCAGHPAGSKSNPDRAIEVTGEASVEAAPDFAKVTLGVTTTDKDASKAMAANARATNALIAALKGEGLAPADIQTSSLSIAPDFANRSSASSATAGDRRLHRRGHGDW